MTLQPATTAFTARLDAARVSRAMAAVRAGIGAIGLLAPGRLAWRLFLQDKQVAEATALVLRAAAGRDLALGLGAALASKRGPGSVRGWMLAAALADGCDALAIATSKSANPTARASAALVSGLSASAELLLAHQLTADRAAIGLGTSSEMDLGRCAQHRFMLGSLGHQSGCRCAPEGAICVARDDLGRLGCWAIGCG
jgi:hypothetical protein